MPATAPWLASAEALFNRNIAASSEARALARRLEGRSLQVEVEGRLKVRASVFNSGLALLNGENEGEADAVISGSAPALLQLLRGEGPSSATRAGVQIRGDAEIANLFRQLFAAARPDVEEELSRWIGDMPARRLSEVARSVRSWARRTRRAAGENIAEYLQEEGRELISKTEHEEFLAGVDAAREAADRIEARLKLLEQRITGGS